MNKHNNLLHGSTASLSAHDQFESDDSIHSSFSNLLSVTKKDGLWTPKILMNISLPSSLEQVIPSMNDNTEGIDIVPYTTKPSLIFSTILRQELKYPNGCTLYFPGYDGPENGKKLKNDIIAAAARDGTALAVDITDHYKSSGNK